MRRILFFIFSCTLAFHVQGQQVEEKADSLRTSPKSSLDSLINDAPVFQSTEDPAEKVQVRTIEMDPPENEPEEMPRVYSFEDDSEVVKTVVYRSRDRGRHHRDRGDDEIRTLAGSMDHSGGFGALTFKSTSFRDEATVLMGLRGGWIINRSLAVGLEGHGIIPTVKYNDIPNVLNSRVLALGGYGGLFLEPIFFSNQVIHFTFPVSAGAGWIGFEEDWENNFNNSISGLIDEDVFWYIEPGAALEVNLARNFRLNMGMSRRFTQDLELVNTEENDFDDWNFFLTLKIGSF